MGAIGRVAGLRFALSRVAVKVSDRPLKYWLFVVRSAGPAVPCDCLAEPLGLVIRLLFSAGFRGRMRTIVDN